MRFAFYIDSPLQLLNCVNIVWHNLEESKGNGDLFISCRLLTSYKNTVEILTKEKLFKRIYIFDEFRSLNSKIPHDFSRLLESLFSERALKNYVQGWTPERDSYDVIWAVAPSAFTVGLCDINRNARLWLYDEGIGCYYGNPFKYSVSWKRHLFSVLFKKGWEALTPERLYVNNLAFCKCTMNVKLLQLPTFDSEPSLMKLLEDLFDYNLANDSLLMKNVFLSQPFDEIIPLSSRENLNAIFDYLNLNHGKETVVRKHPREQDQDYRGLDVAKSNPMWELFCMTALSEEQTLISFFSTAQLTPKLLFDKEPKLIFLYDMMPTTLGDQRRKEIDAFVQSIRDSYRDKNRIHVPKTMQEFTEIL